MQDPPADVPASTSDHHLQQQQQQQQEMGLQQQLEKQQHQLLANEGLPVSSAMEGVADESRPSSVHLESGARVGSSGQQSASGPAAEASSEQQQQQQQQQQEHSRATLTEQGADSSRHHAGLSSDSMPPSLATPGAASLSGLESVTPASWGVGDESLVPSSLRHEAGTTSEAQPPLVSGAPQSGNEAAAAPAAAGPKAGRQEASGEAGLPAAEAAAGLRAAEADAELAYRNGVPAQPQGIPHTSLLCPCGHLSRLTFLSSLCFRRCLCCLSVAQQMCRNATAAM